MPPGFEKVGGKPASLVTIQERGVVRVCYQPEEYPSAFYNNAEPPQLVGFDIEMAHRFAQRLELSIEFIPARDEEVAAERLNAGACDIYMRTLPITAQKTRNFGLTSPIYTSSLGVIVRDHRRNEFQQWDRVRALGASLRLAVEDTPENRIWIQFNLPQATIVPIADMEEQRRILESDGEGVDAIIDMAEEAAAWTVLYPSFSLVVPKPTKFFPVAYAVASENDRLLTALNAWLLAEEVQRRNRCTLQSLDAGRGCKNRKATALVGDSGCSGVGGLSATPNLQVWQFSPVNVCLEHPLRWITDARLA